MVSSSTGVLSRSPSMNARKSPLDHTLIPPCQAACPLHMEIREYVELIAQGRVMEALQVIIEAEHIIRAFAMGAEGVFIAGCGQKQCARENTGYWTLQRMEKSRKLLKQIGLEPQRVQAFNLFTDESLVTALDKFTGQIGILCLASALKKEVKT